LKAQNGGTLVDPVTVYLRGGDYFLDAPLVFGPDDSGTAENPVTFAAYPGETPRVSGGRAIDGWTQRPDGLWSATVPGVAEGRWYFRSLRVGSSLAIRARHPNRYEIEPRMGGWLFVPPTSVITRDRIQVADDAWPQFSNWQGAEVMVFPFYGWVNALLPIEGVDSQAHFLRVSSSQDIRPGNRFYVTNLREALDAPGEWYLDRVTGELLYQAREPEFPDVEVVAPAMDRLVVLQGDPAADRWVENIRFEGLTFIDADYTLGGYYSQADAAIWMSGARNCDVTHCSFGPLGGYAIRMANQTHRISVTRNTMRQMGEGGVIMLGSTATQPYDNLIAANEIADIGQVYAHVAGVYVTTGSRNRIIHNRIQRTTRYAISLKSLDVANASHDNVIEYNELIDTNLETNDTGAIETLGRDQQPSGNQIRFNLIRNVVGLGTDASGRITTPYFTWGIYLDDFSSGTTVEGNIVSGTVFGGLDLHGGSGNTVVNNVFVDGSQGNLWVQPINPSMQGNVYYRNIIVYQEPTARCWYTPNWRRSALQSVDYNLYWHTGGLDFSTSPLFSPEGALPQWQAAGFDLSSRIADPLFVDPLNHDYRLMIGSPAYEMGFQDIPVDRIGPEGFFNLNVGGSVPAEGKR
jgi:parallel beta-helix repeat protein